MQSEERIVVVDSEGRVYDDATRAVAENRARSAAQANGLAKGFIAPADLQREAEYVAPVAVNPAPTTYVPFVFPTNAAIKPEQLNANLAHLGNMLAGILAREKMYLKALDAMTDRIDRLTFLSQPGPGPLSEPPGLDELRTAVADAVPRRSRKAKDL